MTVGTDVSVLLNYIILLKIWMLQRYDLGNSPCFYNDVSQVLQSFALNMGRQDATHILSARSQAKPKAIAQIRVGVGRFVAGCCETLGIRMNSFIDERGTGCQTRVQMSV